MGRTAGRGPEETRRLLLDAAAGVILRRGVSATLADVARQAGVSKGGLIYHFAAKEDLFVALAEELIVGFRDAVARVLEPGRAPGRLTRAYVRASMDTSESVTAIRERLTLTAQLMTVPACAELNRLDSERWDRELALDGVPPEVLTLVLAAADGACTAMLWGVDTRTSAYAALRDRLLAMTETA